MTNRSNKLEWKKETGPQGDTLSFVGVIDEYSAATLTEAGANVGSVIQIDTSGIQRINSLGVRTWIHFMRSLDGRTISYRRCAPAIVEQMNALADFRGKAQIESVLAPYLCESCSEIRYEELWVGKDVLSGSPGVIPERRCGTCQQPMVFDDLPERYFQFLGIA